MRQEKKLCINRAETITGFNYAFTLALLEKAIEMRKKNGLFSERGEEYGPTKMADSVLTYLSNQIGISPNFGSLELVDQLIDHAKELLAIFKTKRCINPTETITGFNPMFTAIVLQKVREEIDGDTLCLFPVKDQEGQFFLSCSGAAYLNTLSSQINAGKGVTFDTRSPTDWSLIMATIEAAAEFLETSEGK